MDNHSNNRKKRRRKSLIQAYITLFSFAAIVLAAALYFAISGIQIKRASARPNETVPMEQSSQGGVSQYPAQENDNSSSPVLTQAPEEQDPSQQQPQESEHKHQVTVIDGITYIDGILIVNKTYSLPRDYAPGLNPDAQNAFDIMAADAAMEGINLFIVSGYRSYDYQESLYNRYVAERGVEQADAVSSRPGHSEHQSGLCMDVNTTEFSFEGTPEALWLEKHCAEYGFIIRFPKGKEDITGYEYEPWHIRYVGFQAAQEIMAKDICLEEYLDVTSEYTD